MYLSNGSRDSSDKELKRLQKHGERELGSLSEQMFVGGECTAEGEEIVVVRIASL